MNQRTETGRLLLLLLASLLIVGCTAGDTNNTSTVAPSSLPTPTTVPSSTSTAPSTTSTTGATTTTGIITTTTPTTAPTAPTTTSTPRVAPALVVTRAPTSELVVALTFDAGSDRGHAADILDTLAAHGIKASFGMTGRWAESNPDLLVRMVEEGHALINHTYDHPHMETLSTQQRLSQLARAEDIIGSLTGTTTRPHFRPPYGSYNNQVLIDVASAGYRYSVMWSVDCLGWKGLPPSEVVARCEAALQPGAILLMHVGAASTDYAALEEVIAVIDQRGYRYATIPELLP